MQPEQCEHRGGPHSQAATTHSLCGKQHLDVASCEEDLHHLLKQGQHAAVVEGHALERQGAHSVVLLQGLQRAPVAVQVVVHDVPHSSALPGVNEVAGNVPSKLLAALAGQHKEQGWAQGLGQQHVHCGIEHVREGEDLGLAAAAAAPPALAAPPAPPALGLGCCCHSLPLLPHWRCHHVAPKVSCCLVCCIAGPQPVLVHLLLEVPAGF